MKFETFRQAIQAKTTVEHVRAEDGPRTGDPRRQIQRLRELAVATGDTYIDKLRQLQSAGLIPESGEQDSEKERGEAYARFDARGGEDRWHRGAKLEVPRSAYELRAGAVIPATLRTGINSSLPGQITAIVAQDVRDTARGQHVLIPQGSALVGAYASDVKFGQERVLFAWQRITFPDGKVLDLGSMPGADGAGYAGAYDQVNNHFWRIFGSALLLSGITGGVALSQDGAIGQDGRPTVGGTMAQSLGQQMGQVSEEMIRRQMNVAPTLEIRPGYRFNVTVTKDLVFSGPYEAFDYEGSVTAEDGRTFQIMGG